MTSMILDIEGVAELAGTALPFNEGERIFHVTFGFSAVAWVDGNRLTIEFDKAGRKIVLENFVERG